MLTTRYEESIIEHGLYAALYLLRYYEKTEDYYQAALLRDAINNVGKVQSNPIPKTVEEVEKDPMVLDISKERLRHNINSIVRYIKELNKKIELNEV